MNISQLFIVTHPHISEFPLAMTLKKGDPVTVGDLYEGPEDWLGWYMCSVPGQAAGFIPEQLLEFHDNGTGTMRENYSNKELNVLEGELLAGECQLNGWVWAMRLRDADVGWVPIENLRQWTEQPFPPP